MATPMSVFAEIASRYGVDPNDEEAVDRFFDEQAPHLSAEQREEILAALLAGQTSTAESSPRRRYASGTPDVSLDQLVRIDASVQAVDPERDAEESAAIAASLKE